MQFLDDILNIIFPKICYTCGLALMKNEECLCFQCRSKLPKIHFQNLNNNELSNRFVGKINIEFAISYLYFYKSGITQKLLHQLKYNNCPEIGEMIGKWLGHELLKNDIIKNSELIIPVPLHPRKERSRGYNQTQYFATGISKITNIPTDFYSLQRIQHETSQTVKTKEYRWKSVEHAFQIFDRKKIENKHILLVDDIVTTGATMEACGQVILKNGASGLSIASLALAK